ncbi:MAG: Inositol 2-dehydrogenase/D-chiro-inositol 3-dehydrogenase [Verrucomicrobiae bacterium]|nr:Inositol 2-dehydrogenase/D-chiro-inositol 3-dehydrogenase [Verrucomicrobiae bacterium]
MNKKYRIGILGCGRVARFSHIDGWKRWQDRVEITALCDILPEQIAATKKEQPEFCGQALEFTDYREMLAKAPLDIVSVCSYGDKHLEHTTAVVESGRHAFMEKPAGYSLEEARRFRHLARQYPEQKVAIAYGMRYQSASQSFCALLRSGILGEILTGEISYSHPIFGEGHEQTHATLEDTGGHGRVRHTVPTDNYTDKAGNYIASSELTHSTHPWDFARYLFGDAEACFATRHRDGYTTMGIIWMKSGALVSVLAGATAVPKIGGNQHQLCQVHGTKGSAWLTRDMYEPYKRHALYRTDGEIQTAPAVTDLADTSHAGLIRSKNFLDAIEGKAELICPLEDAAKTTELLHALWLSERTHSRVPVFAANHTG